MGDPIHVHVCLIYINRYVCEFFFVCECACFTGMSESPSQEYAQKLLTLHHDVHVLSKIISLLSWNFLFPNRFISLHSRVS